MDRPLSTLKAMATDVPWESLADDILAVQGLKKEKHAVILAHNYMTPDIFLGVADIVGDSLALAREAARSEADIIVVAGVHFMAETAKLLNPDRPVLTPDPTAGCSLAESITPEDVRALRRKYPGVPVVTYVNTSAAVKAECDICCTSGNAKKIVESLGAAKVIMVPDMFLAQNTAQHTKVEIIPWCGRCEVHELFTAEYVRAMRDEHPRLSVIAHPECPLDVVRASDFAGSTVGMVDWIARERPEKAMLLTEASMTDNIAALHKETSFVRPSLTCPHMKKITLKSIRRALETGQYEVKIPESIAARARRSVERMIAVP